MIKKKTQVLQLNIQKKLNKKYTCPFERAGQNLDSEDPNVLKYLKKQFHLK